MAIERRGFFNQEEVNKLYPNAVMVQPMGIWQIPNGKKYMARDIITEKQNDYFAEIKKDGNWYAASVTEDNVYIFARTISKKTGLLVEKSGNVPHLTETLKKLPAGSYIEGEIYLPNGNSDLVRTIMGCNAEKAIARQNGKDKKYNESIGNINGEEIKVHYYIHNIVFFEDEDLTSMTNLGRYKKVKEIYDDILCENPYIDLADIIMPDECNFYDKAEELISKGEEGLVLKKKDGMYYPDQKKAWETIKLKRENSVDVVCIGFDKPTFVYEGDNIENWTMWVDKDTYVKKQGNYYGNSNCIPVTKNYFNDWIGAIRFGAYGEDGEMIDLGSVSSGLTDELKENIKQNPNNYLFMPMLVECMEIYHGTSIRSPRLIKFRDDINAKDCTIEKIK